ncbi:MAG: formyltransferase family protein [Bacteroidota bacterium]
MSNFVFFGTGGLLSSICLKELIENNFLPQQIFLQEQGASVYPNLCEVIAKLNGIPFLKIQNINDPSTISTINAINADFGVVASYGQIFKAPLLKLFPIFNVHMGVLPEYRGAYTNFWKILANHNRYGATIHLIDEKIDGGQAALIVEEDFENVIFANDFFRKNYEMAARGLVIVLKQYAAEEIQYTPIDVSQGKYYKKHTVEDMDLNPEENVQLLHAKINRLQFYGQPTLEGFSITESNLLLGGNVELEKFSIQRVSDTSFLLQNSSGILLLKHKTLTTEK